MNVLNNNKIILFVKALNIKIYDKLSVADCQNGCGGKRNVIVVIK